MVGEAAVAGVATANPTPPRPSPPRPPVHPPDPRSTATGPTTPSGSLAMHDFDDKGALDFTPRAATAARVAGGPSDGEQVESLVAGQEREGGRRSSHHKGLSSNDVLGLVHGLLLSAAWCVCAPVAVGLAATCRDPAGRWFAAHKYMQVAVVVLTLVGMGMGIALEPESALQKAHAVLGYVVTVAALAMASALFFRPALGAPRRRAWTLAHKGAGYGVSAVAVAAMVLGYVCSAGPVGWALLAGFLAAFLAIVTGFGVRKAMLARRLASAGSSLEAADSKHAKAAAAVVTSATPLRTLSAAGVKGGGAPSSSPPPANGVAARGADGVQLAGRRG